MRPPRRKRTSRSGGVPAQSRLTAPRAVAALRRTREALSRVQGQLDALLAAVRDPSRPLDADAPDRLVGAVREADAALASLDRLKTTRRRPS
jgi:hypothetical protein